MDRLDRGEAGRPEPRADARTRPGQILKLEARVDRGQIVGAPDHRGIGLVRLCGALCEPGARRNTDRHGHEARQRAGHRTLDPVDNGLRVVPGREPRGNLVDGVHRRDGQDNADRQHHALVNADVALDPLRAHDEAWAQLARIAQPIAGTHAGTLSHSVHGDQRGVGVGTPRDDTNRTAVQARIGGLLARCEESIGVEVEPRGRSRHARNPSESGRHHFSGRRRETTDAHKTAPRRIGVACADTHAAVGQTVQQLTMRNA